MKVGDNQKDNYAAFREKNGAVADGLGYRVRQVNNILKASPCVGINMESVMWQSYLSGASQVNSLNQKIKALTVLCEQNEIEIPEERALMQLARQNLVKKLM